MTLDRVQPSDEGNYTCKFINEMNQTATATSTLKLPRCGVHRSPKHGYKFGSGDMVNDVVWFVCKLDYVLVGAWKRVCLARRRWSGEQPDCRRKCSNPDYPQHGFRVGDKLWEGETVTYHCNNGYSLLGSRQRTCNSSGLWDRTRPLCAIIINSPECRNYKSLTDADRQDSYANMNIQCDNRLTPGWYRFAGAAGIRMPDSCTNPAGARCNTHGTSWLSGGHPTVADGEVTRQVGFSYNRDCWYHRESINVRNCGPFYVYKLRPTGGCNFRYCGTS